MSLPKGFKQLEYIQSSGTQYVDTLFKPNQDTRVVMDADVDATTSQRALFGCRTSYANNAFCLWTGTGNAGYQTDFGSLVDQPTSPSSTGRHVFDKNRNVLTVDGAVVVSQDSTTFQTAYNMFLLQINNSGSVMSSYPFSGKLYSCQIYDNGTLVRDFIPCETNVGEIGLWDDANSVFYGNAGTGTFTAGPIVPETVDESEITELEWIRSSGGQYIDTTVSAPEGFRIDCEVELTTLANGALNMLFGAHDTAAPYYRNFLAATSGGNWEIGAYNASDFGLAEVNTRYTIDVCTISGAIVCWINGTAQNVNESIAASALRSSRPLYLFALNYEGGLFQTSMTLFRLQIYLDAQKASEVRHYVPAMLSNGEVGLYDRVNSAFYRNAGTGEFEAGPEAQTTPKAPANFRVEAATDTRVTLAWDANEKALGYRLYRAGRLLADTEGTSVSVSVEPFAGAVFTLTAYNENGEGAGTSLTYFSVPENPILYLITDRTQADVNEGNTKGYYAASDLNRVGYAVEYLAEIIRGYGYKMEVDTKTDWTDEDWKLSGEMVKYLQSLNNLKAVFSTLVELPETMEKINYVDANNIEQLLLTIDETVARVVAGFTRANAFALRSGAKGLPVSQSDRGRNWGQLDAMETTWANWQLATWYLLLYGNLKAEGVVT